jgi:DNA repair exonuclease SbcCD ATPase subunit
MFPEPMDQMDRAMQRMDKKAWAEADAEIALLKARLAEAVGIVRDLTRQITEFTEREGEADFYTGVAVEFLKKQSPCNHVWARRLRGRETCAVCGVARRPTIDAHLARKP